MSSQVALARPIVEPLSPKIQIKGFDHIQMAVGNAYQAMHFLRVLFGFSPLAYAGLETGERSRSSYVLAQGNIRLIITSPLDFSIPIAAKIKMHGDGVHEISFAVEDAAAAFHQAVLSGATPVTEPV